MGAQLVGDKGFVGIMSDSDRQHDNIPFSSIRMKSYPGQLLERIAKVKCLRSVRFSVRTQKIPLVREDECFWTKSKRFVYRRSEISRDYLMIRNRKNEEICDD